MIQKNCQTLDEKAIWKDNGHYRASKICRIFFQGMATSHEVILSMENAGICDNLNEVATCTPPSVALDNYN